MTSPIVTLARWVCPSLSLIFQQMLYTLEGIPSKDTFNIDGQAVRLKLGNGGGGGGGGDDDSEGGEEEGGEEAEVPEETLVVDDILLTKLTLR
jgi:hypothetical protein